MYTVRMEPRRGPISRIRCPRGSDPKALTAEAHRAAYLTKFAEPVYPPQARAEGIQGKVVLELLIGNDGSIQTLTVRSGDSMLADAALHAVSQWIYRPVKVNGVAVEVVTEIDIDFQLPDGVHSS
jgi:TonB family protein